MALCDCMPMGWSVCVCLFICISLWLTVYICNDYTPVRKVELILFISAEYLSIPLYSRSFPGRGPGFVYEFTQHECELQ